MSRTKKKLVARACAARSETNPGSASLAL